MVSWEERAETVNSDVEFNPVVLLSRMRPMHEHKQISKPFSLFRMLMNISFNCTQILIYSPMSKMNTKK